LPLASQASPNPCRRGAIFVTFAWGFPLTTFQRCADRSVADGEICGNLTQAHASGAHIPYAVKVYMLAGPSEMLAIRAGVTDTSIHPLANQVAFKLCDGGNDHEESLPNRGICLDVFLIGDEPNAEAAELLKSDQQVPG
jgi:hypothetical protein